MVFCPKCGTENKDNSKFCEKCGVALVKGTETENNSQKTGIVDKFKSLSTFKKVISSIVVICCLGLIVVAVVGGLGSSDQNTSTSISSTINVSDLAISSQGYGMYQVTGTLVPDKDYSYLEMVVVFYDSQGAIIDKSPLAWNMNDVNSGQPIKVTGNAYVTGDNTPSTAAIYFFDSAFSGDDIEDAIYNQNITV